MLGFNKGVLSMPESQYTIYTYEQAVGLVMPHLKKLKKERSLKKFCKKEGLSYFIVQMISINHPRQYPDCLLDLLEIFGYRTEREKAFKVFR